MTEQKLYRRIVRRSMHRSRSVLVGVVLVLLVLACALIGTESVLAALGRPALLVSPADALAATTIWLALVAVPGVLLVVLALLPSRRPRHELPDARMAVVVDDSVLAGAVKHAVLRTAGVPAERVSSSISARRSTTRVVPSSGVPIDVSSLDAAATTLIDSLKPRPAVRVGVRLAANGVVGS